MIVVHQYSKTISMLVLIMQSFNALLFVFLTKIGDQIRLLEMKKNAMCLTELTNKAITKSCDS